MKRLAWILSCVLLWSCSGPDSQKTPAAPRADSPANNTGGRKDIISSTTDPGCYGALTELIRSSNFPFGGIAKDRVNILVDEDDEEAINLKLFFETDGTGTIGWVKYNKNTRVLLNTSANLETPEKLTYDKAIGASYDACVASAAAHTATPSSDTRNFNGMYSQATAIPLPLTYSYDLVSEEKGFIPLAKSLYDQLPVKDLVEYRFAKLPPYKNIRPVILIGYTEAGQSQWYLMALNEQGIVADHLKIYDHEEEESGGLVTTFEIRADYRVTVKTARIEAGSGSKAVEKDVKRKVYRLSGEGVWVGE